MSVTTLRFTSAKKFPRCMLFRLTSKKAPLKWANARGQTVHALVVGVVLRSAYPEQDWFERTIALGVSALVVTALVMAWHASALMERRIGWVVGDGPPFTSGLPYGGTHEGKPTHKHLFRIGVEKLSAKSLDDVRVTLDGPFPIHPDSGLQVQGENFGIERVSIHGRPRYFDVCGDLWLAGENQCLGVFFDYAMAYTRSALFTTPHPPFQFALIAEARDTPTATLLCRVSRTERGGLVVSYEKTKDSPLRRVEPEVSPEAPPQTSAGAN